MIMWYFVIMYVSLVFIMILDATLALVSRSVFGMKNEAKILLKNELV